MLELGCGWGSLSLYMAAKYPGSSITAVSNSRTQKEFIDEQARCTRSSVLVHVCACMQARMCTLVCCCC